jgi:hypothetical protein
LYALGYSVALAGRNVLVTNPAGVTYSVNPQAGTCSCPAEVLCCHLRGLHGLMLDASNALDCEAIDLHRSGGDWLPVANRACKLSDRAFDVLGMLERIGALRAA